MAFALVMGAIIGSERQFRGRMAGLRTNALVSLGAAGFVIFAALFPDDINPTRVAAQVVTGIGFLGAGIIFRDGFNIQGINTAATLWCSAAVGLISGSGHLPFAAVLTALIVFSNMGLRPFVRKLKRVSAKNQPSEQVFQLRLTCQHKDETDIRAVLVANLREQSLTLCQFATRRDDSATEITVQISGKGDAQSHVEQTVHHMSQDPRVLRSDWKSADDENGFES